MVLIHPPPTAELSKREDAELDYDAIAHRLKEDVVSPHSVFQMYYDYHVVIWHIYYLSICDQFHTVEGSWQTTEESCRHSESNCCIICRCVQLAVCIIYIPLCVWTWVTVHTYVVQCWYAAGELANSCVHCLC